MRNLNLLLLGAGYTARFICKAFAAETKAIFGTTRDPLKFDQLREYGVEPLQFDTTQDSAINKSVIDALDSATHVVSSIAPSANGTYADPVLQRLSGVLLETCAKRTTPPWFCYLSTVGVYGDTQGAWIDESAPCLTQTARSLRRVEAEREWQALSENGNFPLVILRLPGIYGPGRNAFVNLASGRARRVVKPGHVFNRVHVEDIATAVHRTAKSEIAGIYNICDGTPSPSHEVVEYAAKLMQVDLPPAVDFADEQLSEMARSFYAENKRVSNERSKSIPEMIYRHESYKSGLTSLWQSGTWRQI